MAALQLGHAGADGVLESAEVGEAVVGYGVDLAAAGVGVLPAARDVAPLLHLPQQRVDDVGVGLDGLAGDAFYLAGDAVAARGAVFEDPEDEQGGDQFDPRFRVAMAEHACRLLRVFVY